MLSSHFCLTMLDILRFEIKTNSFAIPAICRWGVLVTYRFNVCITRLWLVVNKGQLLFVLLASTST